MDATCIGGALYMQTNRQAYLITLWRRSSAGPLSGYAG